MSDGPLSIAETIGTPAMTEAYRRLERWAGALPVAPSIASRLLIAALTFVPYLFVGQTWLLAHWAGRRALGEAAALPDFSGVATIPGRMVALHALFLGVMWLPRRVQLWAAAIGALGLGLAAGFVDAPSAVLLLAFGLAFYGIFKLSVPRWLMLTAIVISVPAVRTAADMLGWSTLSRASISTGLIVLLWYACYHVTTGKILSLTHYLSYLKTRLFMEGPVFTIQEFTPDDESKLAELRLAGIEALSIAMVSRSLSHHIGAFLAGRAWFEATGLSLLGYSYLNYLALAFDLVASYNLYLGLLRLFGMPIRDNFNGWFFARTPNEHWRRWNLLLREWIITFTFYPMMRARVPLFLAIMGTLIASGLLHVYAHVGTAPLDFERMAITMLYWVVNGLAIYAVIAFPRRFARLHSQAGFETSRAWWFAGWVATSVFYAVLFTMHHDCESLADVPRYFARLLGA